MTQIPISDVTWSALVECNRRAVMAGWATEGVFAPGIGPDYVPGSAFSLLYVGKSPGPLGTAVGSGYDQRRGIQASTSWMIGRKNPSPFWRFVDLFDPTRRRIAWSNIAKMDRVDGRFPKSAEWRSVAKPHFEALREEILSLRPRVTLFVTSETGNDIVDALCDELGYRECEWRDGRATTRLLGNSSGQYLVRARHPHGWSNDGQRGTVSLVRPLLR